MFCEPYFAQLGDVSSHHGIDSSTKQTYKWCFSISEVTMGTVQLLPDVVMALVELECRTCTETRVLPLYPSTRLRYLFQRYHILIIKLNSFTSRRLNFQHICHRSREFDGRTRLFLMIGPGCRERELQKSRLATLQVVVAALSRSPALQT